MKNNFEASFQLMLKSEGGYSNHPADPGGVTNLGITRNSWERYIGHPVSENDMRSLTREMAKDFYETQYWDKIYCDDMPVGLDYAFFDFAVNSGTSRATKCLQECLKVRPDGIIGPKTIEAIGLANPREVIQDLCDRRLAFLQGLPTWHVFGKGWGIRVQSVKDAALKMAE